MADFEVHITMKDNATACEDAVKRVGFGWTFSCIDGDPLLGDEVFCYATNHFTRLVDAKTELQHAYRDLLSLGMNIVRTKIEEVVWDQRYKQGVPCELKS